MSDPGEHRVYEALPLPNEALDTGGLEILRAGLINDELYVTARRVFKDPATWGEVLGDIARRIATIHSLDETDLTEQEIVAEIVEAFASEMGLPAKTASKPAKKQARPARKKSTKSKKAAKTAKRRKR
jgi:lipoate-protein ligase A